MIDYYNNNTTDRLTADYIINININTSSHIAAYCESLSSCVPGPRAELAWAFRACVLSLARIFFKI